MKLDRLIGILAILLQRERVTAPYLAEKFEVSRRTINRDIETLCMAGIPISTAQGSNGGIYIDNDYKIDKTLLTDMELQEILIGLKSLCSVGNAKSYELLKSKLNIADEEWASEKSCIDINLGSWYKASLVPKIDILRSAIKGHKIVRFNYFAQNGESTREIEPYSLLFQWTAWYVWGWCRTRDDWRLFKLNRMQNLIATDSVFVRRKVAQPSFENDIYPKKIAATIAVEPACKWRVIEEYGLDSYKVGDDGRLILQLGFNDKNYLFAWLMGFCGKAELIAPTELRSELLEISANIAELHK